jgi:hypothetical protein
MSLLDPPILFSLELHIPVTGPSRIWVTPRDLAALPPATRLAIAAHLTAQVDQLYGLLGVTRRVEVDAIPDAEPVNDNRPPPPS